MLTNSAACGPFSSRVSCLRGKMLCQASCDALRRTGTSVYWWTIAHTTQRQSRNINKPPTRCTTQSAAAQSSNEQTTVLRDYLSLFFVRRRSSGSHLSRSVEHIIRDGPTKTELINIGRQSSQMSWFLLWKHDNKDAAVSALFSLSTSLQLGRTSLEQLCSK